MRMEEAFYNISMYLYSKNVLEYAQIARSGPKSMIHDIEGLYNVYLDLNGYSDKFGYFDVFHKILEHRNHIFILK